MDPMDLLNQQVPDPAEGSEADLPDRLDERLGKAQDALGRQIGDPASQANGIDLYDKHALRGSAEHVADLASEALSDPTPEQADSQHPAYPIPGGTAGEAARR